MRARCGRTEHARLHPTTRSWDNDTHALFRHADGRARTGQWDQEQQAHDVTLLIVFNAHHDVVKFKLPRAAESSGWSRLIDTNDPELPARHFRLGAVYGLVRQ